MKANWHELLDAITVEIEDGLNLDKNSWERTKLGLFYDKTWFGAKKYLLISSFNFYFPVILFDIFWKIKSISVKVVQFDFKSWLSMYTFSYTNEIYPNLK